MADSKGPEACPVDHKSREAWLQQARSASGSQSQSQPSVPPSHPTIPTTASKDAESCPVDHKSREAWLQHAKENPSSETSGPAAAPIPTTPANASSSKSASSWSSYLPSFSSFWSSSPSEQQQSSSQDPNRPHPLHAAMGLGTSREVSTIPRSMSSPADPATPAKQQHQPEHYGRAANNEQETGADARSGNWVYPSEKMFFEAMKRKGHDPHSQDMRTVVPIHNAVNERAWAEIKRWEAPYAGEGTTCAPGPRLTSFSGLSTKLSPRARFNSLLGYQTPFDRHDWVVDRCGKEIEYVIDFYSGRAGGVGDKTGGKLSFYLDVRPKLNSWEGVKMRALRATGMA